MKWKLSTENKILALIHKNLSNILNKILVNLMKLMMKRKYLNKKKND